MMGAVETPQCWTWDEFQMLPHITEHNSVPSMKASMSPVMLRSVSTSTVNGQQLQLWISRLLPAVIHMSLSANRGCARSEPRLDEVHASSVSRGAKQRQQQRQIVGSHPALTR